LADLPDHDRVSRADQGSAPIAGDPGAPAPAAERSRPSTGIVPPDEETRGRRTEDGHGWPIAAAAFLAVVGGIGFAVAYVLDASNGWLGAFLGVGLLGIGFVLAYWGRNLVGDRPGAERYALPAEDEEAREILTEELDENTSLFTRRWFLTALFVGGAAVFVGGTAFVVASLGPTSPKRRFETAWRAGTRLVTIEGSHVTRDALEDGGFLIVFPEGHTDAADSQVVLLRLREGFRPQPGREDWSPEGFVAYSRLCTHAGCPVAQYEDELQILLCPCHQSAFDVLKGAEPIAGPAGRALPQLPLRIDDDGFLVARSDFEEPVGPGFWNQPS
jgi:ubiquinol-cytochrome c reductase iron-sulfur subunit